jgi:kynurenine formamidase
MNTKLALIPLALMLAAAPLAAEPKKRLPAPPWPAGDEMGMANQIGTATYARCASYMSKPRAKAYELSHIRSGTMPLSPFTGPYVMKPKATASIPGTSHAFNMESYGEGAEPGQQGTQIDALGHFGYFKQPWDGKPPIPADGAVYYGGYTQKDVKPSNDSPLLKLGVEKIPPIVTSAVLLDAKKHVGGGQPMKAGEVVTAKHIEEMLKAQGLSKRGILPGDVVYVHTGWGDHWRDPDTEKRYYSMAPGMSFDAAKLLEQKRVVAIGLDTPFVDAVADGQLQGKGGPAPGSPAGLPFSMHHHMLTQAGIHHIENAKLDELARDRVWTSCTMILPPREKGSAGAAVRPVAIGVAGKER